MTAPPTVVAVGASAGGLDAFSQILDRLAPSPGVAFVFVQHLSPQYESALATLLSARTPLPVVQATDRMQIEANHVYVMPPNVHMEIADGRLRLLPRPHDRTQFTPIDFFFESLARWAQERAIGVILSGTASDGAVGVREIKAVGGITIAQRPESARYDGMPRAAIATGMVDLVLSPNEIAEHIGHIHQHPYLVRRPSAEPGEELGPTEEQLGEFFALLRRTCGIDFRHYKPPTVRRRLLRRMALHRLTDVSAYLRYMREQPGEITSLCQDLLIHVTRFFRDPEAFKALEAHVLPEIALARTEVPIRIWVPGCATGEEAYSVAIVLMEMLGDRAAGRRIQIFATDVSEAAIERARAGTYTPEISADVSPERLKRFFTKSDGGYRVSKILRDVCVFARHDLAQDPPFSRIDLIVCRNVLIYLDSALQKRLITVFHYALKTRGFLMLGSAETTGTQASFAVVDKKWRIYRKAPVEAVVTLAMPAERLPELRPDRPATHAVPHPEGQSVQEEANRVLLEKYGPPGVVVDTNLEIVHFRGHTGAYLEAPSGEPSLNVLKMARGGLLHTLRSALNTVRRKRRPFRKEGVLVQRNGERRPVTLEVLPFTTSRGEYFLILFETPSARTKPTRGRPAAGATAKKRDAATDAQVADLRRELAANREYLQSIIPELETANEELQAANEEILSSNEELQSTNEELDTAKEELQSTNEELNTLNEELHSRNEELARVNSDLFNVLRSADLPIVIIGDDLAIRRFTPAAERLFNLIPGDVGRPIRQINPNVVSENLDDLVRATIGGAESQEREVQDREGRWYSLGIRPYRSDDKRLDGVVLTAIDIDAAKRYQRQVERSRDYFMAVIETVSQPLLVLDSHLRVQTANKSFCERFQTDVQETQGKSINDLAGGRLDTAELHATLAATVADEAPHRVRIAKVMAQTDASVVITARGFDLGDGEHWILVAMDIADAQQRA
ncbi:MAG TPA: chemotaxis protein CheB [Vicinamibacterales bacterium]|nr:chemotaxis protein CheB [Vicinamibacterales bacterium]